MIAQMLLKSTLPKLPHPRENKTRHNCKLLEYENYNHKQMLKITAVISTMSLSLHVSFRTDAIVRHEATRRGRFGYLAQV